MSDWNREMLPLYGALSESLRSFKGVPKRSAFVIGRDGKIAYAWVAENPGELPDVAKVLEAAKAAADVPADKPAP